MISLNATKLYLYFRAEGGRAHFWAWFSTDCKRNKIHSFHCTLFSILSVNNTVAKVKEDTKYFT